MYPICRYWMLEGCNKNVERVLVIISYFITYTPPRGESLFTYFASLACALIFILWLKQTLWILKECENFSYLLKFWAQCTNILSLKNSKFYKECTYMGSLQFGPPAICTVFDGCYFLCYCLQRAENCTNCSN